MDLAARSERNHRNQGWLDKGPVGAGGEGKGLGQYPALGSSWRRRPNNCSAALSLKTGTVSTNVHLRKLQLLLAIIWLPWPNIATRAVWASKRSSNLRFWTTAGRGLYPIAKPPARRYRKCRTGANLGGKRFCANTLSAGRRLQAKLKHKNMKGMNENSGCSHVDRDGDVMD